jgi:hypothetical protein
MTKPSQTQSSTSPVTDTPSAPLPHRTAEAAWAQDAYAPLATEGPIVEGLRAKLAAIAVELGHPQQVEQVVEIRNVGFHRALLAQYVTIVRLVSPKFTVAGDERRLGVALGEIQLDGKIIPFEDLRLQQGFHDIEQNRALRWTDGDAFLVLDPVPVERVLRLRVVAAAPDAA